MEEKQDLFSEFRITEERVESVIREMPKSYFKNFKNVSLIDYKVEYKLNLCFLGKFIAFSILVLKILHLFRTSNLNILIWAAIGFLLVGIFSNQYIWIHEFFHCVVCRKLNIDCKIIIDKSKGKLGHTHRIDWGYATKWKLAIHLLLPVIILGFLPLFLSVVITSSIKGILIIFGWCQVIGSISDIFDGLNIILKVSDNEVVVLPPSDLAQNFFLKGKKI
ncbi:DUF3267 domain-containing protein [Clostridium paraputrificum]|uniref:DUF3267 domain-containing protein n=1 Tax=Clostridium paraputrificum TaxID=29363 RepID=UPI000669795F|nr:DUF3267 domain-containing protein [Clostridium paraputrificum]